MKFKNPYKEIRSEDNPYEIWEGNPLEGKEGWKWIILHKYDNPEYRATISMCKVYSPDCPEGKIMDEHTCMIVAWGWRTYVDKTVKPNEFY